ncbi:hypothetical protein [Salimicrobium flavidum]|uniref:Scaffolding protein n=1 Tax=Salimicrobium flavidum TaxID=570947 RepID=A0A1N7JXB4_9BACI|nr:hypothetical protein [Salimicrobium flavidum]SIS53970.1 hypothetical protein SAMN05421687_10822 [Salimicrobium flavidum]
MEKRLKLDLQFFAEEPEQPEEGAESTEKPEQAEEQPEGAEFTEEEAQEEIERRVREALEAEEGAEIPDYKGEYLGLKKKVALVEAGVPVDQTERYAKYITADEPEAIEAEAREIATDATQPKKKAYGDPSQRTGKTFKNPFKRKGD